MNIMFHWADVYNPHNTETYSWPPLYSRIKKAEPFLSMWINRKKLKKIVTKVFTTHE